MAKRIIQTEAASEDVVIEKGLRPSSLDQYVGQEKAKNNLKIFIEAAKPLLPVCLICEFHL